MTLHSSRRSYERLNSALPPSLPPSTCLNAWCLSHSGVTRWTRSPCTPGSTSLATTRSPRTRRGQLASLTSTLRVYRQTQTSPWRQETLWKSTASQVSAGVSVKSKDGSFIGDGWQMYLNTSTKQVRGQLARVSETAQYAENSFYWDSQQMLTFDLLKKHSHGALFIQCYVTLNYYCPKHCGGSVEMSCLVDCAV